MNDNSQENVTHKEESKPFAIKLQEQESIDSSNNSQNSQNEDDLYFSSNFLISKSDFCSKTIQPNSNSNNKLDIFDSEDILLKKKNLFNTTCLQKSDNKEISEGISTDQGSVIKVRNYNSPRKRYSVFKLIEKDKRNKKDLSPFFVKKKEDESPVPEKKERTDIYGNIINKKNKKKVKVSFVDDVTNQPLTNVIDIESYKKYNYIFGIPKEEKLNNITSNCVCCIVF